MVSWLTPHTGSVGSLHPILISSILDVNFQPTQDIIYVHSDTNHKFLIWFFCARMIDVFSIFIELCKNEWIGPMLHMKKNKRCPIFLRRDKILWVLRTCTLYKKVFFFADSSRRFKKNPKIRFYSTKYKKILNFVIKKISYYMILRCTKYLYNDISNWYFTVHIWSFFYYFESANMYHGGDIDFLQRKIDVVVFGRYLRGPYSSTWLLDDPEMYHNHVPWQWIDTSQ